MTIHIALLRGINVGGKNKIKMVELRQSLEASGLENVQTYIQSGNILFASDEKEDSLRKQIEQTIKQDFGLEIPVVLRTAEEMKRIAENCPFSEEAISEAEASSEGESLYVSLLMNIPSQGSIEWLNSFNSESEQCVIQGRDVYLLFQHSVRNSKLANQLSKLDVPSTMRNWKTINKLLAMVHTIEP